MLIRITITTGRGHLEVDLVPSAAHRDKPASAARANCSAVASIPMTGVW